MPKALLENVDGTLMVVLPPDLADKHHLAAGSQIEIAFERDTLLIGNRVRKRYTWDELMARCDPADFVRTEEDEEFLNAPPVGREMI